jgi:hypothetical protein
MSARLRGVLAIAMVCAGVAMSALATPAVTGGPAHPLSSVAVPWLVGSALVAGAALLSLKTLRRVGAVRRDVRRGLRQIEVVLRLEAALAARRLVVPGGGCPSCGAPAGPHCVCRKR